MKEQLERLLAEAERQREAAFRQQDNTAKHFYGGQIVAYKAALKLLPEEG